MISGLRNAIKSNIPWGIALCLFIMLLDGCKEKPRIFTIGIVNADSVRNFISVDGFKSGMSELGYEENKNIKYIYCGITDERQEIVDAEIKKLLSRKIDLIFVTGTELTLRAEKALDSTNVPLVFSSVGYLKELGSKINLPYDGVNTTGVTITYTLPKTLEWIKRLIPDADKIYVPYNPDDSISVLILDSPNYNDAMLGIESILQPVHSVEEAVTAIENLPEDIDAILRIPSPTLDPRNSELSKAAIKRGLPIVSTVPLDKDLLMTFSSDFFDMGKQSARLAQQILSGVKPRDLPVEAAEVNLTINLNTAKKIGLEIPNDVLIHAKTIIRD